MLQVRFDRGPEPEVRTAIGPGEQIHLQVDPAQGVERHHHRRRLPQHDSQKVAEGVIAPGELREAVQQAARNGQSQRGDAEPACGEHHGRGGVGGEGGQAKQKDQPCHERKAESHSPQEGVILSSMKIFLIKLSYDLVSCVRSARSFETP